MSDAPPVILLVEDEFDLLEVLESALQHARPGWQVASFRNPDDAGAHLDGMLAGKEPLSLAVVDYQLGRQDGLGILTRVRTEHPQVPTLMVTGQAPAHVEQEARDMGARVLWKPLDLRQFLSTVDELLAS